MARLNERTRQKIRRTIIGTADRPRLSVNRSLLHLHAQLIDDASGKTLGAAHSLKMKGSRSQKAQTVAKAIAAIAKEQKIKVVVFDRAGRRYAGVIKVLAETIRVEGVQI